MKIPKQKYTAELKELSVNRVKAGQTIGAVAKDLGLIEQILRSWVKAAEAAKLKGANSKIVTPEQMEFSRLRAENVRLKRECEILKCGGVFRERNTVKYAWSGNCEQGTGGRLLQENGVKAKHKRRLRPRPIPCTTCR